MTELTAVLDGTCNTVPTEDSCGGVMEWMSETIVQDDVCGSDLREKNSIALEALYGMFLFRLFFVRPPCSRKGGEEGIAARLHFLMVKLAENQVRFTDFTPCILLCLCICLTGFRSYDIYRQAGCIVNPRTNAYCTSATLTFTIETRLSRFTY